MKFGFGEDCCGWVAEDEQDLEVLRILQERAGEMRVEHGTRMFRDYEITIYLPTRQPPERVMDTKDSDRPLRQPFESLRATTQDRPISNLPEPELIPSAERKSWARLIKEEGQRSD